MTVETKSVKGRRDVAYANFDELLADAEQLAESEPVMVGNWTLGQIFEHLAIAFNGSIDGVDFKVSWPMQVIARLFMKNKFVNVSLPSGFKFSPKAAAIFTPDEAISNAEGLAKLKAAVERCKSDSHRVPHPIFGALSREEWDSFHLRHAEMHMSFAKPPE